MASSPLILATVADRCYCWRESCARCWEQASDYAEAHAWDKELGLVERFGDSREDLYDLLRAGTFNQQFSEWIQRGLEDGTVQPQVLDYFTRVAGSGRDEAGDAELAERKLWGVR